MRFKVLGHASLLIKTASKTVLIDPWLVGSCYWRSWWHFPPAVTLSTEELSPDYIYVSHYHFDHFHYPSMRKLNRQATVLIPEFAIDTCVHEFNNLGFKNVVELPHGKPVTLDSGFRVASYQFGLDDSAFLLEEGAEVLLDLNDCKINGSSAKKIISTFGHPTFLFKSHSFAGAFPNCYSYDDPSEALMITPDDYRHAFYSSVRELSPEYAIPFASMVGFFHPETQKCNSYLVTPVSVAESEERHAYPATSVVVMGPGDTWDPKSGFMRSSQDYYKNLESNLALEIQKAKPQIDASLKEESKQRADFNLFEKYFREMMRALPPLVGRFLLARPIVFFVASDSQRYWILDFKKNSIQRGRNLPDSWGSITTIPDAVLMDAIQKKLVHFINISMRVSSRVAKGGINNDLAFWGFLGIWELGYFPLRALFTPRAISTLWRRRREILQTLGQVPHRGAFAEKMVRHLMRKPAENTQEPDHK